MKDYYIEKWKVAMQMWDNEANRFWMRSNIFLLLNGGLIVLITSLSLTFLSQLIISAAGIALGLIWIKVNDRGVFYLNRWKPIIEDLEQYTEIEVIRRLPSFKKLKKPSSTTYMKYAIFVFLSVYVFFFILNLLKLLNAINSHCF